MAFRIELSKTYGKNLQAMKKKLSEVKRKFLSFCEWLYILQKKQKFKNKNVSIISNDCAAGVIYHRLNCRFNSPFINLYIEPSDFIKLLNNFNEFINGELLEDKTGKHGFPVGILKAVSRCPCSIHIYFMHYKTFEEAKECWNRRKQRINYENSRIIFDITSHSDFILENKHIDILKKYNYIIFAKKGQCLCCNAKNIFTFKNIDNKPGRIFNYKNGIKKYIDDFDYVRFLNN